MTRGNQREVDRQRAQKKQEEKIKAAGRGGDPLKRNENDASALQAKVAAKQAAAAAAAASMSNPSGNAAPIVPKKATAKKADAGLDDLLNAGLTGGAGKKKSVSAK